MSAEIKGLERIKRKLSINVGSKIIKPAIEESLRVFDQISNRQITQKVYNRPPSPTYQRTGRARRGREMTTRRREGRHVMDTKIAGAERGYSAALNRNRRIEKNDTRFWDDSVDEFKGKTVKITAETLVNEMKKIT